jgi:hypothetical protein
VAAGRPIGGDTAGGHGHGDEVAAWIAAPGDVVLVVLASDSALNGWSARDSGCAGTFVGTSGNNGGLRNGIVTRCEVPHRQRLGSRLNNSLPTASGECEAKPA